MQVSANTSVKTIEGHFTCHTKSVITKPQNVFVIRDVLCNGYVGGCGTKFFGEDNTPMVDLENRLAGEDPEMDNYASCFAFAVPPDSDSKRDQVISLSQRVLPWEVGVVSAGAGKEYFPGGAVGFEIYKNVYGLSSIHYGEDMKAAESQEYLSMGSVNNALCFLGPHRVYSEYGTGNGAMKQELIPGQGHFGTDALPGDARWRRGEAVSAATTRAALIGREGAIATSF